ncbi:23 kDa jasmonate-induced protein-like [Pyrus communis]|uniref:23 kDa jasmonate-induced protein-like n=1 Tax=Pyrus communis TaxID=23211 RepID=UPI0035BF9CAF
MADNVFGNPITDDTLKGMPDYSGKEITRLDRAHVALNMKNAGEKNVNARNHADKWKKQYGIGCVVYNATGDMIKFHATHDWHGHIGEGPYPQEILNGQWGAFSHVHTNLAAAGSNAAVVYRGVNNAGSECDWMLSWSNPFNSIKYDNKVYTEVGEAGHFDNGWHEISKNLDKGEQNITRTSNGCVSIMSTGIDTSPVVEAILTLEHADEAKPTTGHAQVLPTVRAIPTSDHA